MKGVNRRTLFVMPGITVSAKPKSTHYRKDREGRRQNPCNLLKKTRKTKIP